MKMRTESFALSRPFSRIREETSSISSWSMGEVVTRYGIVIVYADSEKYSRLDFAIRGRHYMRTFHGKRYSHRGLAKKAGEFARELSKAKP